MTGQSVRGSTSSPRAEAQEGSLIRSQGAAEPLPPLVAIVGATASGKSGLALALAERFGGEIVNADSRQVFRGMDIGTAKPTAAERARVPHHLIDIVNPDEALGLVRYLDLAQAALEEIWSRGRLPFLVGGTGQYVWALVEGWQVPRVPPEPVLRAELEERAAHDGLEALYGELRERDPLAAERVDRKNIRRLVRALEVAILRGSTEPGAVRGVPPDWRTRIVGIEMERAALYGRIDRRVEAMLAAGLVEEVGALRAAGYGDAFAMTGIGYREASAYLDGAMSIEAVGEKMKASTHRLARTQSGWFRRGDWRIHWLAPEAAYDGAAEEILKLPRCFSGGKVAR